MEERAYNLTALLVFALAAFAYIGWTHRTKDPEEYHTVKRRAGLIRTLASLFTVVGASEFVVFTTLAYLYGWDSVVFFAGALGGFLCLYFLTPLIRRRGAELDQHSIPDFAAALNLKTAARLLTLLSIVFTCALALIQVVIGTLLIQNLTAGSFMVTAGFLLLAIFLYLYWGGYEALLYTDIIQGVVLVLFTAVLGIYIHGSISDSSSAFTTPALGAAPSDFALFFFGGLFAIAGGPEIWQRVLTSRDNTTARKGLLSSGVFMLIWGAFVVWVGTSIHKLLPNANADNAFVEFLQQSLPGWLLGFILVMLLAAILSTADTELFAASVIAHKELSRQRGSYQLSIAGTRGILLLLCLLVLLFSYFGQDILNIYFGLVYLTFITGPIALALLLNRGGRTERRRAGTIVVSICLGLFIFGVLLAKGLFFSWYPLLIAVITSIPLLIPGPSQSSVTKGVQNNVDSGDTP